MGPSGAGYANANGQEHLVYSKQPDQWDDPDNESNMFDGL